MDIAELKKIVSEIKYKDWNLFIGENKNTGYYYLQVRFKAPDNYTGVVEEQYCRKWQLSLHMCPSEVVRTAYKAVLAAEEHEVGEHFKYKGQLVFCPHVDVEALVDIMKENRLDVREELGLRVAN